MANNKYYISDEHELRLPGSVVLHRVRALRDFKTSDGCDVARGDFGGWVESEKNLSQEGNSWIWHDAKVYGDAVVSVSANVCGNAVVCGCAKVTGNAKAVAGATVGGDAVISGHALITDNATVKGMACVYEHAVVGGAAVVTDNAHVFGEAAVNGSAELIGDVSVYKDVVVNGGVRLASGKIHAQSQFFCVGPFGKDGLNFTFNLLKHEVVCQSFSCQFGDFASKMLKVEGLTYSEQDLLLNIVKRYFSNEDFLPRRRG